MWYECIYAAYSHSLCTSSSSPTLDRHQSHYHIIMTRKSSKFPKEIVSDEEKDSIEASSLASATHSPITPSTSSALPLLHNNAKSIKSVSVKAKRRIFMCAEPDIEDYGNLFANNDKKKKKKAKRVAETLLDRFRSKRGLFVTDVSKTEWCEKQMEFSLFFEEECKNNNEANRDNEEYSCSPFSGGGTNVNKAMRAGIDRHVHLHQEIQEPVKVKVKSCEDYMAVKLINFINGVNQLESEGLTRELPIVSFVFAEGIWMVGKIDEIRMAKGDHNPILVETKTRSHDTVPLDAQKRNGMIQLMCYKYLWDNLVSRYFPCREFCDYYELNPEKNLGKDLQNLCCDSGFPVLTLDDLVVCYKNRCKMLPRCHDELVLRYESQRDQSLLDEDKVTYDGRWLKGEIRNCLEFWLGQREADLVAQDEEWKCGHCDFVSECHAAYSDTDDEDFSSSSDDSSYCY